MACEASTVLPKTHIAAGGTLLRSICRKAAFCSFLKHCLSGGKGPLAEEEERLFKLRQEKEELVQKEISKQRQMFEREAKEGQLDKLCATPFGVDVVGITEFIALTGALVGGMSSGSLLET